MSIAHIRILIHEFLNKDPVIVPEEAPLLILDRTFSVCMDDNVRDAKYTRHVSRRVHFVRNGEK